MSLEANEEKRLNRIYEALSSVHHTFLYYPKTPSDSLIDLLEKNLPHIPSNSWSQRFSFGGVYCNGRGVKYNFSPLVPCKFEYFEPKDSLEFPDDRIPKFDPSWIVYEDEWIIVVHKPRGLSSLPTREQRNTHLKEYLENYVGHPIHLPSRLDTSTEGLVVVSKHPDCHNELQRLFSSRSIEKYYLFEGTGCVNWQSKTVALRITKDRLHPVLRTTSPHDGKPSRTDFEFLYKSSVLNSDNERIDTSLIVARPRTGRTHQIRVHARAIGVPIVGDSFYEGAKLKQEEAGLRLFSWKLSLVHPITKLKLELISPKEKWPIWSRGAYELGM